MTAPRFNGVPVLSQTLSCFPKRCRIPGTYRSGWAAARNSSEIPIYPAPDFFKPAASPAAKDKIAGVFPHSKLGPSTAARTNKTWLGLNEIVAPKRRAFLMTFALYVFSFGMTRHD